jgi:hypothetical protein
MLAKARNITGDRIRYHLFCFLNRPTTVSRPESSETMATYPPSVCLRSTIVSWGVGTEVQDELYRTRRDETVKTQTMESTRSNGLCPADRLERLSPDSGRPALFATAKLALK